jgi:hypothetical protein
MKHSKLTARQKELLDSLGFEWDRSYYLYSKLPHKQAIFQEKARQLQQLKEGNIQRLSDEDESPEEEDETRQPKLRKTSHVLAGIPVK